MLVSFFQYLPKFNSFEENLTEIQQLIAVNYEKLSKTKLLVFPEYSFTGPLN